MLKLYKSTIIVSLAVTIITLATSILCEKFIFPHALFVQNYSIGLTCSLIVVIITAALQYQYEHERLWKEYRTSLRQLIFIVGLIYPVSDDTLPGEFFDDLYSKAQKAFDNFRSINAELIWFSRKKAQKQEKVYDHFLSLWLDFHSPFFDSKLSVLNLAHHKEFIPLIDSAADFLPDGYDKQDILQEKSYAIEPIETNAEEEKNNPRKAV